MAFELSCVAGVVSPCGPSGASPSWRSYNNIKTKGMWSGVSYAPFNQGGGGRAPAGPPSSADGAQWAEQRFVISRLPVQAPPPPPPVVGFMGGFPSGQRGQTVNLLATLSKVRILLRPFQKINFFWWVMI